MCRAVDAGGMPIGPLGPWPRLKALDASCADAWVAAVAREGRSSLTVVLAGCSPRCGRSERWSGSARVRFGGVDAASAGVDLGGFGLAGVELLLEQRPKQLARDERLVAGEARLRLHDPHDAVAALPV